MGTALIIDEYKFLYRKSITYIIYLFQITYLDKEVNSIIFNWWYKKNMASNAWKVIGLVAEFVFTILLSNDIVR